MTKHDAVRIACRLFALYLLFWVVSDCINLPHLVLTVRHELELTSAGPHSSGSYYLRSAVLYLASDTLRVALWSLLALYFYRCDERIQRFFGVIPRMNSGE